jgi:prolyl 4-hydroxylase
VLLTLAAACSGLGWRPHDPNEGSNVSASAEWHGSVENINWRPRASRFRGFLTPAECDFLIAKAKPFLKNSTVLDNKSHQPTPSKVRTSAGMFFRRGENAVIRNIEERIAKVTHLPVDHGEGMQVLNYHHGQEYQPHHDFFHEGFPDRGSGQRIATVLMYLTTPEEGGETVFPLGRPHMRGEGWSDCAKKGHAVKATRGDAVFFWALKPDGGKDRSSLHGSCPTLKGEKWSATKWIHVQPYS